MQIAILATILLTLASCSTWQQTAYRSTQAYQRNECQKLANEIDRQQCLKKAVTSYDDYKRQTADGGGRK